MSNRKDSRGTEVASRDAHRKCRRRLLFAALVSFILLVATLLMVPGAVKLRVIEHITWKDLVDDFTGDYENDGFRNGTFLSYDPPVWPAPGEERLPSQVIVMDRILEITNGWVIPLCTYPPASPGDCSYPSFELDLASNGPGGRQYTKSDYSMAIEQERSDLRDLKVGDEVVIRLTVYDYWHQEDPVWKWASEGLRELSSASSVSRADPATNYVHVPPAHNPEPPRRPVQHPYPVRQIGHDLRDPGVTVLRVDQVNRGLVLDLGALPAGGNRTFIAAFGLVAEDGRQRLLVNTSAKGPATGFLSLLAHNRSFAPAQNEGGVMLLKSGVGTGNLDWLPGPQDGDETTAHSRPTPVNPVTGVRWLEGDDDATGTDTVWIEAQVEVPVGTPAGKYSGEIEVRIYGKSNGATFAIHWSFACLIEVE